MRIGRSMAIAAAVAVLTVASVPSASMAVHSWSLYHWGRTGNPFTVQLGDNVSSAWDGHLATTSTDWTASSVLNTSIVAGLGGSKCRPSTGRVEVCAAKYGRNGWLGLAQIWISGAHITQGVTKMNDTYFTMPRYDTVPERNHVMCQEVGHTFGLGHQSETGASLGTCMDYSTGFLGSESQHPNDHDYAQLETIYGGHLDGTTTVAATPASIAQADVDGPNAWGRKIHSSKGGKHEQFERDFGNGHKVITEVIWVDDDLVDKPGTGNNGKPGKDPRETTD